MSTTRRALIANPGTASVGTIQRYLPGNYSASVREDGSYLIEGQDSAGWTLDGYVIPRLASGLYFARELPSDEAAAAFDAADIAVQAAFDAARPGRLQDRLYEALCNVAQARVLLFERGQLQDARIEVRRAQRRVYGVGTYTKSKTLGPATSAAVYALDAAASAL